MYKVIYFSCQALADAQYEAALKELEFQREFHQKSSTNYSNKMLQGQDKIKESTKTLENIQTPLNEVLADLNHLTWKEEDVKAFLTRLKSTLKSVIK